MGYKNSLCNCEVCSDRTPKVGDIFKHDLDKTRQMWQVVAIENNMLIDHTGRENACPFCTLVKREGCAAKGLSDEVTYFVERCPVFGLYGLLCIVKSTGEVIYYKRHLHWFGEFLLSLNHNLDHLLKEYAHDNHTPTSQDVAKSATSEQASTTESFWSWARDFGGEK